MSVSIVRRIDKQIEKYTREGFRQEIPCLECKQKGWKRQGVLKPVMPYTYNNTVWMRYQCTVVATHTCIETAQRPSTNDKTGQERWDKPPEPVKQVPAVTMTEVVDDDDIWKDV